MHRLPSLMIGAALLLPVSGAAQQAADEPDAVSAGRERYLLECALCHGDDARGDGPYAPLLTVPPPSLRLLAARAGGAFPLDRVVATIDGRAMPLAHGTREMPLFGQRYAAEVPYGYQTIVRGYILELVLYLESIQER